MGNGCCTVIGLILLTMFVVAPILSKLTPYGEDCAKAANAERIIAAYEEAVAMAKSNAVATAEAVERNIIKDGKIRSFALKESPTLWQTVQKLRAEKESLETGIARVETVLRHYGRDAGGDSDIIMMRQDFFETEELLDCLLSKLEDAYLKYVAYQEMPEQETLKVLCENALLDGAREASAAEKRFIRLREQK